MLIVREHEVEEDQAKVVESEPVKPQQQPVTPQAPATISTQHDSFLSAYIFVCFSLVLVLATLAFQLYSMFNPPIATVTIIPKSQQVTLNDTLQLGRVLPPITISQSARQYISNSITGALQGQLNTNEQLQLLPCHPTVTSDKQPGEEAIQVKISVSLTCSAIAYDTKLLETKATQLLTTQGLKKLGSGYSLFGNIQMKVNQASISNTTPHLVFLSIKATGTWIYGISQPSQQRLKALIAGKSKDQALHIITAMLGVEHMSIRFSGFGDTTRIPKTTGTIHLVIIVV